jgi:hypothetical protein
MTLSLALWDYFSPSAIISVVITKEMLAVHVVYNTLSIVHATKETTQMQTTFSVDLSTLKPHQRKAFLALVQSFFERYTIPTSDESEAPKKKRK